MRAVRAETQHPLAAEGLHRPAVHLAARPANGFPQRVAYFDRLEKVRCQS